MRLYHFKTANNFNVGTFAANIFMANTSIEFYLNNVPLYHWQQHLNHD